MPKTDINTILKNGSKSKVKLIDYSTPEAKKKLKELKNYAEKSRYKFGKWHPPIIINT